MGKTRQALYRMFTARRRRILEHVERTWRQEQEDRAYRITQMEQELGWSPIPEGKQKAPSIPSSWPGTRTRLGRRLLAERRAAFTDTTQGERYECPNQ